MNIFWLSLNMALCAQYHCNKHCCKQIIEYAQLLCTAHHVLDGVEEEITNAKGKKLKPRYRHSNEILYKPTHINHPCAIWVRKSKENYNKLYNLFSLLCKEYTHRYGKTHLTETKLLEILKVVPVNIKSEKFTFPPLAIADESIKIKIDGKLALIASYRNYYNIEKRSLGIWTNREVPKWFKE